VRRASSSNWTVRSTWHPAAYQRDRRKRQLLQENGYFVLRLLADDVANELDTILDAVLHSLTLRRDAGRSPLLTVERRTPA